MLLTKTYISALDKAGKSGLVHVNKIARHKARCAALIAPNSYNFLFAPVTLAVAGVFFMLRAIMSQSTDVSAIGFPPPVLEGSDCVYQSLLTLLTGWHWISLLVLECAIILGINKYHRLRYSTKSPTAPRKTRAKTPRGYIIWLRLLFRSRD